VVSGGLYSSYHYSRKAEIQAGLATTNGAAQVALATTQAGIATTQANNSANSATASQDSRLASEAARDAAQTSETNAAGWAAGVNMPSASGNALKVVRQNTSETGFEYVWGLDTIRAQMIGTVSQAAGVPTGAIIEYGSNANGRWTKWADGTMITNHRLGLTLNLTTTFGSMYYASVGSVGYPVSFVGIPARTITVSISGGGAWAGHGDNQTASATGSSIVISPISRPSAVVVLDIIAVGRWY
jgi:hypothetical protein